jgi:hypothetical protein
VKRALAIAGLILALAIAGYSAWLERGQPARTWWTECPHW